MTSEARSSAPIRCQAPESLDLAALVRTADTWDAFAAAVRAAQTGPEDPAAAQALERRMVATWHRHARCLEAERARGRAIDALEVRLSPRDRGLLHARSYDRSPALVVVERWLRAGRGGELPQALVLAGPAGVGKTFAACATMVRFPRARYVRMPRLASMRNAFADREAYRELVELDGLLVVDELCTETSAHEVRLASAVLCELFDERAWSRPTLLLTNAREPDLLRHYAGVGTDAEDGRLSQRFGCASLYAWVPGPSQRQPIARGA